VLTQANKLGAALHDTCNTYKADLAASTEAAIVEVLVKKSMAERKEVKASSLWPLLS